MKTLVTFGLCLVSWLASAQAGPIEQTMDTARVGGDEHRQKMSNMEAHDRLHKELVLLRDSVYRYEKLTPTTDANAISKNSEVKNILADLTSVIDAFKQSEYDPELYQRGLNSLKNSRANLSFTKHVNTTKSPGQ